MKTKHLSLFTLLAVIGLVFQSCSSDKDADVRAMLATVPSDVSMVAVVHTQTILEKAGCKVDGDKITPGQDLNQAMQKITDQNQKRICSALFNGESGINPSAMVFFQEGFNTYFTGIVADSNKFKKFITSVGNPEFTSSNGFDVSRETAIKGNRFWLCLNNSSIDINDVRHFDTLSESQSFLQNSYAETMISSKNDAEVWGNISGLLNTAEMKFEERTMIQMGLQALFEDPANLTASINFVKGAVEAQATVLNSKGNVAKFLLPTDQLDVATIASIGGTADLLVAFSLPSKLINKLKEETKSKLPSAISLYLDNLSSVDGTVAVASSQPAGGVKGTVTTTGQNLAGLTSMLSGFGLTTSVSGNLVNFSHGTVSGKESVGQTAELFKGTIGGFVMSTPVSPKYPDFNSTVSVVLASEKGGLCFKGRMTVPNENTNAIITLLNY